MRFSKSFIPTLKQVAADTKNPSHILLLRGGYIRQVAAGIFSLLPLGLRVVEKIKAIVREELAAKGALETLLPMVHPATLWQESNRWKLYGPELLRFNDRKGVEFVLCPTAEEVMVDLVRNDITSYRQLPVNLYQIQNKFRDEARPRAGLLRGREFIMKDGYSFHASEADAMREYQAMYDAYTRIFTRCGLDFRAVEADTGAIGGNKSHEFQVLANTGEDRLVSCSHCGYAANIEKAVLVPPPPLPVAPAKPAKQKVQTPSQRTIAEVAAFLQQPESSLVKTLLCKVDERFVAILVRGDREFNECKLKVLLQATEVALATPEEVKQVTGTEMGFLGPVDLPVPMYADWEVTAMANITAGANEIGYHFTGLRMGVDFQAQSADLRMALEGDLCGNCQQGHYRSHRGIEVGHVFFLGTKYSKPLKCEFLDPEGKRQPMIMGTYGIGITRIMAAAIEQRHDDKGIVWPLVLAPFQVVITTASTDPTVVQTAEGLYNDFQQQGVEVLYDDRDERPGVKFIEADLLGIPMRITLGKRWLSEQTVELAFRDSALGTSVTLPLEQAQQSVLDIVRKKQGRHI